VSGVDQHRCVYESADSVLRIAEDEFVAEVPVSFFVTPLECKAVCWTLERCEETSPKPADPSQLDLKTVCREQHLIWRHTGKPLRQRVEQSPPR
jgi:hypothetical protein